MSSNERQNARSSPLPEQDSVRSGMVLEASEYANLLRQTLAPNLQHFADFFADMRRVKLVERLLVRHFVGASGWVLNVGCGPFATECFVPTLHRHRIVSFDYTRGFA